MSTSGRRVLRTARLSRPSRCALLALALSLGPCVTVFSQTAPEQKDTRPLSLQDLVQLVRAGMSEEVIITRIKRNARAFDLSAQELLELKRDGVSDTVIKYLLDPSLPYTPPPPPAAPSPAAPSPAAPGKKYPADPSVSRLPPEPGMYALQKGDPANVELKVLVPAKSGGLGKLSAGLLKGKPIGILLGARAKVRVTGSPLAFHYRLPQPGNIEEVVLVELESKGKNRELEFASAKGKDAKPGPQVESMRAFETVEVGPKLYRITIPSLEKGEYLFYLIGSADPQKGIQGKGYDFGVD